MTYSLDKLPRFLLPKGMDSFEVSELKFEPVATMGRKDSSIAWLFKSEEPDGCAAAIIRYAPGNVRPPHKHPGAEIIYVLEGEMKNSQGVLRKGDLALYPTGSSHQSSSEVGCTILMVWERLIRMDIPEEK
ncbi:cupin domain-containing protein [Acetobacteraceae bacterium ESL0709]|nr:cupin domain-containing protein [Acetobacteraceae bacterium ESL0697]MDF7677985.1 cupin domain-containing protein [Acetobacteraceae bacterium ESL0709]